MKRLLLLFCTGLIALSLCSCMDQTQKNVKHGTETIASEVKENMDNMIENGTVNDSDGDINDHEDENKNNNNVIIFDTTGPTDYIKDNDAKNNRSDDKTADKMENDFV